MNANASTVQVHVGVIFRQSLFLFFICVNLRLFAAPILSGPIRMDRGSFDRMIDAAGVGECCNDRRWTSRARAAIAPLNLYLGVGWDHIGTKLIDEALSPPLLLSAVRARETYEMKRGVDATGLANRDQ